MGIVLNRDMGESTDLDELSAGSGVPILARIPFRRHIAEVYARGGNAALEADAVGEALSAVLAGLPGLACENASDEMGSRR